MKRPALALTILGFALACDQSTAPAPNVLPPATPNAAGAVAYFDATTVTRSGGAAQTVEFDLDERAHGLFMEPFVLHVQLGGDDVVRGVLLVDGLPVLDRRDFETIGTEPYSLEVPLTASSKVTVELDGQAGGTLTFRVDAPLQPAPVITITSPSRHSISDGAFLEQGTLDPSVVQITGTACHERFPITELEVAGVNVSVPGTNLCEPFSVTQQSRWGMSIITGRARNSRGREGRVVQAYTRGPEHYGVPSGLDAQTRVRGLYSHLTQSAIDDGSRADLDDLATLIKRFMDLTPLVIPASIPVPCNDIFEVRIPQQTLPHTVVINSLTATATHLSIDVTVNNPSIALSVRADPLQPFDDNCDGTLVENAVFSATSIRVTANLTASGTPPGGVPGIAVSMSSPVVTVTGAGATSTSQAAAGLLNGLTTLSASLINSFFGDFILDLLAPTMSDLLNGLIPTVSHELALNGATISLETGFSGVAHGTGFLRTALYGLVAPVTQLPGAVAPRGPLRALCGTLVTPCPGSQVPMPPFTLGANTFAVALHQDMANEALWSTWRAGAFTLSESSLTLSATMPPVSMATEAGDPMGEVKWGDVRVTATFDPTELGQPAGAPIVVESWVSATVRGNVQFEAGARVLALSDVTTTIDVQLIGPALPFDDAVVRAAIADRLRAPLTAFTSSGLAVIPIPDTDPRLVNAVVSRSGFFYILAGALQ